MNMLPVISHPMGKLYSFVLQTQIQRSMMKMEA